MKINKRDMIQFLLWMRNGIVFVSMWFLILLLAYCSYWNVQSIATDSLIKMILWIVGGVCVFNIFFTSVMIHKWSFMKRLTGFMLSISIYECIGFYNLGIFTGRGSTIQWMVFIGIVLVSYLISMSIYVVYSKKKGKLYTEALEKYQKERNT